MTDSNDPHTPRVPHRRFFLRHAGRLSGVAVATVAGVMAARPARAAVASAAVDGSGIAGAKRLALVHTHTGEQISLVYAEGAQYEPEALRSLDRFLRDHYSGSVGRIDPRLYDLLHRLQTSLEARGPFEIISGYRDERTNAHLRQTRGGGVARKSLHMEGRALDVRLQGVALADLRDAALSLRAGGVGFYPRSGFVHVDTGRVRSW